MKDTYVLKLYLDSPLQAYGVSSKWDVRDSGNYPSKSAIIGMIACAMGLERGNSRIDELAKDLQVSVRIDKPGVILNDLQTVNYPIYEVSGKIKRNRDGSEYHPLLEKEYLQDAIFTVFIVGKLEVLTECFDAFQNPVWPAYLGRKCCVPSSPICVSEPEEIVDSLENYIKTSPIYCLDRIYKNDAFDVYFQYFIEDIVGNISLFDNPSSKGQRYYNGRNLRKGTYKGKIKKVGEEFVFEQSAS